MIEAAFTPPLHEVISLTHGGVVTLVEESPTHRVFQVHRDRRVFDIIAERGTPQETRLLVAAKDEYAISGTAYHWLKVVLPHLPPADWHDRILTALDEASFRRRPRGYSAEFMARPDDAQSLADAFIRARQLIPIDAAADDLYASLATVGRRIQGQLSANMREGVYKRRAS